MNITQHWWLRTNWRMVRGGTCSAAVFSRSVMISCSSCFAVRRSCGRESEVKARGRSRKVAQWERSMRGCAASWENDGWRREDPKRVKESVGRKLASANMPDEQKRLVGTSGSQDGRAQ
eukprot:1858428-Pleurochrysis_carterae.AAC.1